MVIKGATLEMFIYVSFLNYKQHKRDVLGLGLVKCVTGGGMKIKW